MSNSYNVQIANDMNENTIILSEKEKALIEINSPQKNEILILAGGTGGGSYIPEDLSSELSEYEAALTAQEDKIDEIQSFLDIAKNQLSPLEQLVQGTLKELSSDSITSVKSHTFRASSQLKVLNIPNVTQIGDQAFHSCPGLTVLDFPKLQSVGSYAFQGCTGVHRISMPQLPYITASTFTDCTGLTEVDFPLVNQIGNLAFSGCTNLKKIILRNNAVCKMTNTAALNNTPIANEIGYVYVPDALVAGYQTATNWNVYANQIRPLSDLDRDEPVLPSAYQQVEYIENTGTQYIDTQLCPDDTYGYRIKIEQIKAYNEQCPIGCMVSGNRFIGVYFANRATDTATQVSYGYGDKVGFASVGTWGINQKIIASCNYLNNRQIIFNGALVQDLTDAHISGTIANSIHLFNRNFSTGGPFLGRIYYTQITKGDETVADLVPCYRKSDGVIGMYDLVRDKFFTNMGTGTFLKGENL